MTTNFYVYEHWRLDRDECFYVGKGRGRRAYGMVQRNSHHRAIQAKLSRIGSSMEVRIVADGLTERQAFDLEVERIAFWKNAGADLTNMTDGGEGATGHITTEETRIKIGAAAKGNRHAAGKKLSAESRKKLSKSLTGNTNCKHYRVKTVCLTDGIVFSSVSAASAHYKISRRNIAAVCRGNRKTAGGKVFAYAGHGVDI